MHAAGKLDAEPCAQRAAVRAAKGNPLFAGVAIVAHSVNELRGVLEGLKRGEEGQILALQAAGRERLAIEAVLDGHNVGLVLGGQLRDEVLANAVVGALRGGKGRVRGTPVTAGGERVEQESRIEEGCA